MKKLLISLLMTLLMVSSVSAISAQYWRIEWSGGTDGVAKGLLVTELDFYNSSGAEIIPVATTTNSTDIVYHFDDRACNYPAVFYNAGYTSSFDPVNHCLDRIVSGPCGPCGDNKDATWHMFDFGTAVELDRAEFFKCWAPTSYYFADYFQLSWSTDNVSWNVVNTMGGQTLNTGVLWGYPTQPACSMTIINYNFTTDWIQLSSSTEDISTNLTAYGGASHPTGVDVTYDYIIYKDNVSVDSGTLAATPSNYREQIINIEPDIGWYIVSLKANTTEETDWLNSTPLYIADIPAYVMNSSCVEQIPLENSTVEMPITFYTEAPNGNNNLTDHNASVSLGGNTYYTDGCVVVDQGSNMSKVDCNITMHHYYAPGLYDLDVSFYDNDELGTVNLLQTNECEYFELLASDFGANMNLESAEAGNQSFSSFSIFNTGNVNLTNVSVKGFDLIGSQIPDVTLATEYFSFNIVDNQTTAVQLAENSYVSLSTFIIPNSYIDFYFFISLPPDIFPQMYYGTWYMSVQ